MTAILLESFRTYQYHPHTVFPHIPIPPSHSLSTHTNTAFTVFPHIPNTAFTQSFRTYPYDLHTIFLHIPIRPSHNLSAHTNMTFPQSFCTYQYDLHTIFPHIPILPSHNLSFHTLRPTDQCLMSQLLTLCLHVTQKHQSLQQYLFFVKKQSKVITHLVYYVQLFFNWQRLMFYTSF